MRGRGEVGHIGRHLKEYFFIYGNKLYNILGLYERSKLIRKCAATEGMEFCIPLRLLSRFFDLAFLVPQKRVLGKVLCVIDLVLCKNII